MKGGFFISLSIVSKKSEVIDLLETLREILEGPDFNVDTDLVLIEKEKPDDEEHSTPYTLLNMEYDRSDVAERLRELTVAEYSETKLDRYDMDPPFLYVFGKEISGELIFIKLKTRGKKKQVICVSFHYAREKMSYPYA